MIADHDPDEHPLDEAHASDEEVSDRSTSRRADEWTGMASAYARGLADVYAGVVGPVLDTVATILPLTGSRLLDVGCGTGRLVSEAVARGADVTGVDPAPDMRAMTRAAAPAARVVDGMAPVLPLDDDSFDIVTADFVLDHAGDPRAALADIVRVARSGGAVATTIWAPDTMLSRIWAQVAAESRARPVHRHRLPEHLDFARTGTGLAGMLDMAGLRHIEVHTVAWLADTEPDGLWAAPAAGIGELGHLLRDQEPETVQRARVAFDGAYDGSERLICEAILAIGVKP